MYIHHFAIDKSSRLVLQCSPNYLLWASGRAGPVFLETHELFRNVKYGHADYQRNSMEKQIQRGSPVLDADSGRNGAPADLTIVDTVGIYRRCA